MKDSINPTTATPPRWGGCATLTPENPRLWIVSAADDGEVQGFSLAEIIDAGLRQKIVGLAEIDTERAIADCVADTLDALQHLK